MRQLILDSECPVIESDATMRLSDTCRSWCQRAEKSKSKFTEVKRTHINRTDSCRPCLGFARADCRYQTSRRVATKHSNRDSQPALGAILTLRFQRLSTSGTLFQIGLFANWGLSSWAAHNPAEDSANPPANDGENKNENQTRARGHANFPDRLMSFLVTIF